MIPGQIIPATSKTQSGNELETETEIEIEIEINRDRDRKTITVANTGDRPIQVGSHYHFYETNPALAFDREAARGYRLDIPAGTAIRFEPGQSRQITLVAYAGTRTVYGFRAKIMGPLDPGPGGQP